MSHDRPDRGVHLVRLGQHHHRGAGRPLPHPHRLRDGQRALHQPSHLHVQHALRLLHPLQVQVAIRRRHEQGGRRQPSLRRRLDAGSVGVSGMFLGLLDPDPDLLVRGPDPDPSLFL